MKVIGLRIKFETVFKTVATSAAMLPVALMGVFVILAVGWGLFFVIAIVLYATVGCVRVHGLAPYEGAARGRPSGLFRTQEPPRL